MDEGLHSLLGRAIDAQEPPAPPAKQDLGVFGHLFGARYASTNIAGIVVIAMVIMLGTIWHTSKMPTTIEREFVTGAFSLISLVLGYLFGASRTRS